jgi:hypothetical protein
MGLMFRRRRPLLGAAMLAGAGTVAYQAGKRRQADENAYDAGGYDQGQYPQGQYDQGQYDQSPPGSGTGGTVAELERLKALLDQGVLTPAEFNAAKQKVLAG